MPYPMPNNQTKPNQTQTTPLGAGGMNRGRVEVAGKSNWTARATERTPMRVVYAKELAWAEANLPDEYGPFVALAIESVKRQGLKPSTATVMAHLVAIGRDAGSRNV